MRPPPDPRVLACVLAGALIAACDSGGHLVPVGPGSGGDRAGAGGGPAPANGGAGGVGGVGGSLSSGTGGNLLTGAGGITSTGTGGIISTGAGGNIPTGTGGIVSTGTGGSLLTGAGGSLASAGGGGAAAGSGSGGSAGGRGGDSAGGRGGASSARCGNGVRDMELFERCDGEDLAGETCQSVRGFASGTLRCSPSSCLFDTSACSPCTKDPAVISCDGTLPDLSPFAVAMGTNGTEVALAWATSADAGAGRMRLTRLNATLGMISTVRVNEPGILAAGYGGSDSFSVAPLPSGWVVAGRDLDYQLFVHTFDAAGANVGRRIVKVPIGDVMQVVVVPRSDGGPLLVCETTEADSPVTHVYAAVVSADGASTTAPVEVPLGHDDLVVQIGRGTYADGQFYVPFTTVASTDLGFDRVDHLQIARVSTTGTLSGVADPLPGVDVHSPVLATAGGQLALSYLGTVDGAPPANHPPKALLSLRLPLSGGAASSPPLVLGDPATPAAFLAVGDAIFQVLQESNVLVGPGYLGEVLELVRVPADGPLGETHRLLAAGELPSWSWLDAVRVGSDIVIAWIDGGERPLQLMRARP